MRYVMKQKIFALGDDFIIRNEAGEDCFFVDGKVFTIGAKLSFQDMNGHELAFIKQKLLNWGPTYEIYRDDTLVAVVKKKLFTLFHCQFTVDVPGPDDLTAKATSRITSTRSRASRASRRRCQSSGLRGAIRTAWMSVTARTTFSSWPARS